MAFAKASRLVFGVDADNVYHISFSNEMVITQLKADLEVETANKNLVESDLKFAEKILIKIQSSFKHFKQVLRQVGEDYEDQVDLESSSGESESF